MEYTGHTTFPAEQDGAVLTVTFDSPPFNIQGLPMMADRNTLAHKLETDRSVKVVIFQSAHPRSSSPAPKSPVFRTISPISRASMTR